MILHIFWRAACNGAGELVPHALTRGDNVGTGPSVLIHITVPPNGILLQRLFISLMLQMCSPKYHSATWVSVFCQLRASSSSTVLKAFISTHAALSVFFYKRQCLFPNCSYRACLTVWKTPVSKQTLSIGRNASSKLPFPNFQEMLVKKHGTVTVSGTETPPASVASAAARVSSVQSFNNFLFFWHNCQHFW